MTGPLRRLVPLTALLVVLLAIWAPRAQAQSATATPTDTPSPTATVSPTDTPAPDPALVGEWSSIMNWPLVDVHMGLLPTGELVMWDAWETGGTQSATVWDPVSQLFRGVPNGFSQMFCAGQVLLSDGRLLVAGGHNGSDIGIVNTTVFDPQSRSWTRVADMNYARWYPTAITLGDGRVLALGGEVTLGVYADVPEVYDPGTNVWTP